MADDGARGFSRAALCVVLFLAPACGRASVPAASEVRERAYRANNRGVAQLEQFNYTEGATAFREALQIDGGLSIAHVNLSLALLYAQDLAGAAREAAEGVRLLPS